MTSFRAEAAAMGLRVPPHSNDAEQAVLGGLMLSPRALDRVAGRLAPDDFYRRDHRVIFKAMLGLSERGTPCDAITLGEWFVAKDLGHMVDATYLMELANTTPSAANIVAYAAIVRDHATRRRVIDTATRLVEQAFAANDDTGELLDSGITELMGMQRVETTTEFTLRQALSLAYERAEEVKRLGGLVPGISTGLTDLDDVLGGFHDSDLIVIGARPAMGKTALLLNLALAAGRQRRSDSGDVETVPVPAGLISTEQPVVQLGARFLAIEAGIKASRLRNGSHDESDLERMFFAVQRLQDRELVINDRASVTIADVQRTARRWKQERDIGVLWVDYIQRIHGSDRRAKKNEQVAEVAAGLKDIGRELDIPVVALGQVRREVENRADKRPNMGDLSDSSEIEKEGDQIAMIYRDEVYNAETADKGLAEILIEKNRHGPTGLVRTQWIAETMKFADWRPGRDWDA
ncbi:replicative DNA helicase [Luteibacter sp. UNC138MFCol5.1]|uniref:replicative DNA helicase n=1 Tax=Luteibacter sp. UNC138MFCol5.1 TaxID=1502774 RepID=UPI0008BD0BA8|nr:replicative DNA helicase [Luteibacter sp. UNC138MFCol5.1]SEO63846.1 replicative DNA helicase [Luteibacter sp. UNC138MFCol5.1]